MIDQAQAADHPSAGGEGADRTATVDPPVRGDGPELESAAPPREIGGRQGPDPTRYGDWELRGRCIDF